MASFTILEPMSTGDVIDRAVRLYRRNFTPLVAITAVPTLTGYVVSLMFWYGYTSLLTGAASSRGMPIRAIWMLVAGAVGYPIWMFALLSTVCGLSRVVGDHLMLGTAITFRRCFEAVRKRIGAITLMGLLIIALLFAAYIVLAIVMFLIVTVVVLIVGAVAAAHVPQWVSTTILIVGVIVAVALALLSVCIVAARVVFLPQVLMIEGESAANALGRAIRLGKGNWYRVAAIVVFTYFVSLSLLAALTLPVFGGLYLAGMLNAEFFLSPAWNILYTSFRDVTALLSLPIWIVSFTLLYFDSRVRKEAYDVDLLAREINPGFYWQPAQTSVLGYQIPVQNQSGRTYVQTSPLGLAGYRSPELPPTPSSAAVSVAPNEPSEYLDAEFEPKFEPRVDSLTQVAESSVTQCSVCGASLMTGARFCITCGNPAQE